MDESDECIASIISTIDNAVHDKRKETLEWGNHCKTRSQIFKHLRIQIPINTGTRTIEFEEEEETLKRYRVSFVTISNVEVHTDQRNNGNFTKLISELSSILWTKYKRVILLECIVNQSWYEHLLSKDTWFRVFDNPTSLFFIPNIDEIKSTVGTSPWRTMNLTAI